MPAITLLVCTYNRADDLRELLATAVVQETDSGFDYEILIIDNNSTDQTREVAQAFADTGRVRYLRETRELDHRALVLT